MKNIQIPAALSLCAAGFLVGRAAHQFSARQTDVKVPEAIPLAAEPSRGPQENTNAATKHRRLQVKPTPSNLRSTDTLETLTSLDDKSLYARLALWMVDASEQDIATYWQSYRQKKDRDNDINDLIFINWTRLNPAGAIAAATGTKDEHYAWWAWSCHDPKAALTAAIAKNPDRVNNVTWGIGEFHPEWLREHFDEIPESGRDNAFEGLGKWDDHSDPLEILKFLKEKGYGTNEGRFQTLARRDPWAAYDWIKENGTWLGDPFRSSSDLLECFIKTVGEFNPEVLQRIAEQTPSGETRRKFEAAVFNSLVKSDPEEAMKLALETKASLIASDRLATVGLSLISTDPNQAFELAKTMFERNPEALSNTTTIRYGYRTTRSSVDNETSTRLITTLLAEDPDRVMAMAPPSEVERPGQSAFLHLAGIWAALDVEGLAHWVNRQTDPSVRESAASTLINQLQNDGNFREAAEWTMSQQETSRAPQLPYLIQNWSRGNPEEARQWLESATLPDDQKQNLKKLLQTP